MGHARYEELGDLQDVLRVVRGLPGITEPRPGIFYLRRSPFLHFHTAAGRRWADARIGATWGAEIEVPFGASGRMKVAVLREIRRRHRRTATAVGGARGG